MSGTELDPGTIPVSIAEKVTKTGHCMAAIKCKSTAITPHVARDGTRETETGEWHESTWDWIWTFPADCGVGHRHCAPTVLSCAHWSH